MPNPTNPCPRCGTPMEPDPSHYDIAACPLPESACAKIAELKARLDQKERELEEADWALITRHEYNAIPCGLDDDRLVKALNTAEFRQSARSNPNPPKDEVKS